MASTLSSLSSATSAQLMAFRDSIAKGFLVAHEIMGQVNGFVFSINLSSTAEKQADITDHYTERNVAIEDHIALKPLRITLTGYVGEKVLNRKKFTDQFLQKLADKLKWLAPTASMLTDYMMQLYVLMQLRISKNDRFLEKADTLYKIALMAMQQRTKQQQAYAYFQALMNQRQLVTVVTPYDVFRNMAVESISATQDEQSVMASSFSVTFKQIRIADTKYTDVETNEGYRRTQMEKVINSFNATQPVDDPMSVFNKFKEGPFK